MGVITLFVDDPMVVKTLALENSKTMVEVGFIPNDAFCCKVYGRHWKGFIVLVGEHSRIYGCPLGKRGPNKTQTEMVEIIPTAKAEEILGEALIEILAQLNRRNEILKAMKFES